MSESEWLTAARGLIGRALEPAKADELNAEIEATLDKIPHVDVCATTIAFSPGKCDCGRDALMIDVQKKLRAYIAILGAVRPETLTP